VTGQSGFSIERRTHTLSNGEIIWDLSGNVWEWTNDSIMAVNKPTGGSQFTAMTGYGTLSYDLTRPSNTWNSTQNMGVYSVGSTTGGPFAFLRGGGWDDTTNAGVFTLILHFTPSTTNNFVGFRCVLR
jgi:formylglycine-generating enzyme required for sulfatase activity